MDMLSELSHDSMSCQITNHVIVYVIMVVSCTYNTLTYNYQLYSYLGNSLPAKLQLSLRCPHGKSVG